MYIMNINMCNRYKNFCITGKASNLHYARFFNPTALIEESNNYGLEINPSHTELEPSLNELRTTYLAGLDQIERLGEE